MNAKRHETERPVEKEKKGTPKGQLGSVSPFPGAKLEEPKAERAAKTSETYWKSRVRPRLLPGGARTAELYVRMKQGGRDAWIPLHTANRADAARRARDYWIKAKAQGLDAVLESLKPAARPAKVCTLGNYLEAAKQVANVRPRTLAEYEASLRRVVAGVRGIAAKSNSQSDRREWRAQVDRVRLDQVTPSEVRAWQKRELAEAQQEGGEVARDRRSATVASHIRDARALFSEAIVTELRKTQTVTLPEELPFSGIAAAAVTRAFVATLDPRALYAAASELDADTRTAFDLLLCAGLRRGEADALPWSHVDLAAGTVRVDVTPTFRPKSRTAFRTVPIPADMLARLKARRAAMPHAELVLEGRKIGRARKKPGEKRASYEYRARAWVPLAAWLRKQGLKDLSPLHALRKMSGSFIYAIAGLEAARRFLGHRDVSTTARSYVDAPTAVVNLG